MRQGHSAGKSVEVICLWGISCFVPAFLTVKYLTVKNGHRITGKHADELVNYEKKVENMLFSLAFISNISYYRCMKRF
jgi:hypothetical protein